MTLAVKSKAFAFLPAALLVLVGFSAAVTEPLAVTGPASETESSSESVSGGNGLTAAQAFGGEFSGYLSELLLEITATGDAVTLTAIVESADGLPIDAVTATVEFSGYDALWNVRVVISSSGAWQTTLAYRPFGICAYGCGSEPRYAYTGEYRETTQNLIYLHSRWYDPTIGRFLSPDDRLGRMGMPQDQNRYAYVVNNPMKHTDPTGHFAPLVAAAILILVTALATWTALATADWLMHRASNPERAGFAADVLLAFAYGLAIGALCAASAGAGCALFAVLAAATMGSIFSAATYVYVTSALGGTPTQEGFFLAAAWGGIAGGAGASAGARIYQAWSAARARALAAEGANAPATARTAQPDPDFAPPNPKTGFPGGRAACAEMCPKGVTEEKWVQGVYDVGNRQRSLAGFWTETDPPGAVMGVGSYEEYGWVGEHHTRVYIRNGWIVDAWPGVRGP